MRTTPRSRLLLIELLFDLLIFVVCAVVCISLLVRAHVMSRDSYELTNAVYLAQTAAETHSGSTEIDGYTVTVESGIVLVTKDGRTIYTLEAGVG